ncbi:hypothetical protein HK100_003988 [Physocladia obscura]|uniref:Adhesin domain-containing protein n=1 Tax=Physocladia obscura TaxID=109957 RepID=A0AAD5XD95_9FUNG|nr:hypothetical protein HK100_003988 [Physocladia obscura]
MEKSALSATTSDSFKEPISKLEFTTKTGNVPIELIVTSSADSKITSVSSVIRHTAPNITVSPTLNFKTDTLTVHVTAGQSTTHGFYTGSNSTNEPAATVTIDFPSALEAATIALECGSLKWRGPNTQSFNSSVQLGETNISASPFHTDSLNVKSEKGAIKIANAVVSNKAVLENSLGEIDATVSGYKHLNATLSMGELKVYLTPGAGSRTELGNSLGGLVAKVSGFVGRFDTKVILGKAIVKAPGNVKKGLWGSGYHSGSVGDGEDADGLISAKNALGSVTLEFIE